MCLHAVMHACIKIFSNNVKLCKENQCNNPGECNDCINKYGLKENICVDCEDSNCEECSKNY